MTEFEERLHDAADGPVRFDHRDIVRRVRHRRRNRLAVLATVVVLGVVGVVAGLGDDDQVVDSVGPVTGAAVTAQELIVDRWVAVAYSAVTVPPSPPPFLEFGDGGELGGVDGCRPIHGTWELDGARLVTSLEPFEDMACANGTGGLTELLQGDPTVGRFDEHTDTVKLTSGDDFIAFERFDRLGETPAAASLEGSWASGSGTPDGGNPSPTAVVTFAADGTGHLQISKCSQAFQWTLDNDALAIDGLDANGVPCDQGIVGGGLLQALTSTPRLRVQGTSLWVSSDLGVDLLRSEDAGSDDAGSDPPPPTTTTPDDAVAAKAALDHAARSVRFVTATPNGVTLHQGGGQSARIADGAAAVAFAIDTDVAVYQPASSTASAEYPPSAEGAPVAWLSGEARALPVESDARSVRLLDATRVHGAPVALVAESYGGVGPEDTFEDLVLIDLQTLERTTVVHRPAWESGHFDARVLPDGDVIGLVASESLVLLARWNPRSAVAVWTTEVTDDRRPTLTTVNDEIRVVDTAFDENFQPVLRIRHYDTDGVQHDDRTVPIADPTGELGAGLFCTGWYDDVQVVCGRSDGPPIVISLTAHSYEPLDAATGAYPMLVRPD